MAFETFPAQYIYECIIIIYHLTAFARVYLAVDPDSSVSAGLQGLMCFERRGRVTELKVGRLAANIGPVRTII